MVFRQLQLQMSGPPKEFKWKNLGRKEIVLSNLDSTFVFCQSKFQNIRVCIEAFASFVVLVFFSYEKDKVKMKTFQKLSRIPTVLLHILVVAVFSQQQQSYTKVSKSVSTSSISVKLFLHLILFVATSIMLNYNFQKYLLT